MSSINPDSNEADIPLVPESLPGYPKTYQPFAPDSPPAQRPQIFDTALRGVNKGFRLGDPVFQKPADARRWYAARRQVIDHLLRLVVGSVWHLVLRGSLLLKAWLGEAAREPGDIDWVFTPDSVGPSAPLATDLFTSLTQLVTKHPRVAEAEIDVDLIAINSIWTYERADGRRIVFPWHADGLPAGMVHMDVVFGEHLWSEPIDGVIPALDGDRILVRSASPELSLAWKLLWLQTDDYAQGKDLYDATLLAEHTRLRASLLNQVLQAYQLEPKTVSSAEFALRWDVDWENFQLEYPWVEGDAEQWKERLARALAPTFAHPAGAAE